MRVKTVILIMGVVLFTGGLVQATDIYFDTTIDSGSWSGNTNVYDTATLTVEGGNIESISAFDNCVVDINGGSIETIFLYGSESATINLYAGDITLGFHGLFGVANEINIFGNNFTEWQDGQDAYLSGKWGNGLPFEFYFLRSDGLPDIVTLHVVPEPLTIFFLSLGGGLILYKRKI